ncbi:MAG: hypothetical protein AVDCRST_MAG43-1869 [uncultured Thermomicrobiales bacterium]|uniref:Uncharacterized protein n=1 Tax=uncultured Thermomicrobiales bacterium TaxID=1645740 RepID=A0A6J4UW08_9BACT|nr:MAG: hypothetical protein AVDCRST_MAG43-1869 [uncultured Thermomicrobiales bacterium]
MTHSGLNHRLRQRSRRAGAMIGVSMALTIALCLAGFSVIYASLDDVLGDFVSREQAAANVEPPPDDTQVAAQEPVATQAPAEQVQPTAAPTVAPEPTAPPTEPPATPPDTAFTPDYQTSSNNTLNLRSGPSSEGGDATVVAVMPPASPLQYLNEDAPTDNPAQDGNRWMRFVTEDGDEGWIREIDVEPYQP